jgi:hypothetical protein
VIEQGIQMLVQADATVLSICSVGGFFGSLPKDQPRPSWAYKIVSSTPLSRTLGQQRQVLQERWQIDCFGDTPASALLLAKAVDAVLNNYSGTLPDPDATAVQAIFFVDLTDFFDDTARSYRRCLEYQLTFTR